jgi:hypothetical protein
VHGVCVCVCMCARKRHKSVGSVYSLDAKDVCVYVCEKVLEPCQAFRSNRPLEAKLGCL